MNSWFDATRMGFHCAEGNQQCTRLTAHIERASPREVKIATNSENELATGLNSTEAMLNPASDRRVRRIEA